MKKLLFIHNKLVCGGAEMALYNLLTLLDKRKYDITVFVLHDGGEWEELFRAAGIRVIHSYSRLAEGNRLQKFLLRKKIEKARANLGKNLISVATGEAFDLVIGFHVPAAFMFAGQELDAPKIRYIHGDAAKDSVLRGNILASKEVLSRQDRIICVSEWAKQAFLEVSQCKQPVCACYNPLNSEKVFVGAKELAREALPQNYICAVGRLSPEKGFARLIQIHKRLLEQGVEHGLVIVGDGPEKEELQRLIAELGVRNSVVLTGYRQNPYCYTAGSVLTVCSSFSEGLHMASMESLCLGVPVVAAYPTVAELFGNVCCGIITENDDTSLEAGIRKMLTDSQFYELAKNGAAKRSFAFRGEVMAQEVERIYDAVMEGTK